MATTTAIQRFAEASKADLVQKLKNLDIAKRARAAKEAAAAPMLQGGLGLAAVAGGAAGGVVAGLYPEISKVPTDAIVGVVLAVPCLLGAGNSGVDALALGGYGMLAGAVSRISQRSTRDWREKRAADAGNATAKQKQALRSQLAALEAQK